MDYASPTLLVISGPNGAGKSTFIQSLLPEAFNNITAFDRDKTRMAFEEQLRQQGTPVKEITPKATRMMESVLEEDMNDAITAKNISCSKHHYHIRITGNILTGLKKTVTKYN